MGWTRIAHYTSEPMNKCCLQTWTFVIVYHYFYYCVALLYLYDTFVCVRVPPPSFFICSHQKSSKYYIVHCGKYGSMQFLHTNQRPQKKQQRTAAIYCTAAAVVMTVIACINCAIYRRFHNVSLLLLLLLLQWPLNMIFGLFVVQFTVEIK